jgi:hypothetical protein
MIYYLESSQELFQLLNEYDRSIVYNNNNY